MFFFPGGREELWQSAEVVESLGLRQLKSLRRSIPRLHFDARIELGGGFLALTTLNPIEPKVVGSVRGFGRMRNLSLFHRRSIRRCLQAAFCTSEHRSIFEPLLTSRKMCCCFCVAFHSTPLTLFATERLLDWRDCAPRFAAFHHRVDWRPQDTVLACPRDLLRVPSPGIGGREMR